MRIIGASRADGLRPLLPACYKFTEESSPGIDGVNAFNVMPARRLSRADRTPWKASTACLLSN